MLLFLDCLIQHFFQMKKLSYKSFLIPLLLITVLLSIVSYSGDNNSNDYQKIFTHDVAMLLPARNLSEVNRLLGLDATPESLGVDESIIPVGRGNDVPILSKETFEKFINNEKAKSMYSGFKIGDIPTYEKWKIVSARFIPCARPRVLINGELTLLDRIDESFSIEDLKQIAQLEHRLVAQPFDENGNVLDFTIHIISRPYRSGDVKGLNLSKLILNDILELKNDYKIGNSQDFGVYPKSESEDVLSRLNEHIVTYYGGGLLRTLAFMGSSNDNLIFFSGSGRNSFDAIESSFKYSNLIRPLQSSNDKDNDAFQIVKLKNKDISTFAYDVDGNLLEPTPSVHQPSFNKFINEPSLIQNQIEVIEIENPRKFILQNTDCASCHGATSSRYVRGFSNLEPTFSVFDNDIRIVGDQLSLIQNKSKHFINFGYTSRGFDNRPEVSQRTINHAALTAQFIRRFRDFWTESSDEPYLYKDEKNDENDKIQFSKLENINSVLMTSTINSGNYNTLEISNGMSFTKVGSNIKANFDQSVFENSNEIILSSVDAYLLGGFLNNTGEMTVNTIGENSITLNLSANEADAGSVFLNRKN